MRETRNKLLAEISRAVPLTARPFHALGEQLDLGEEEIIAEVRDARREGLIRRIGAVFDLAAFGYELSLVAMRVAPDRLDEAGAVAAAHPGVSHAYARDGQPNLWFTLAVSPNSNLGLTATAERLARLCGADKSLLLPGEKRYKLGVQFDSAGRPDCRPDARTAPKPLALDTETIAAGRVLQEDLPAEPEPFAPLANDAGLSTDRLLGIAGDLLGRGAMRRYAAILHHRRMGSGRNVLGVWQVPSDRIDEAAQAAAEHPALSHVYSRAPRPGWAFNLYTMIHAADKDDARIIVSELTQRIRPDDVRLLPTTREYKKQPVTLFCEEEARWEKSIADQSG
jgi:DNA-binding Lrp family transcriptional regulator